MKNLRVPVLALALLVSVVVPAKAQFDEVGSIDFPTSVTGEAQHYFLRGVAILHSFGWKQAIEQFHAAQAIDPDFAMAYWGESLAYNHPLNSRMMVDQPREALDRLAPTPADRLAKAPTSREKGLLSAVEVLWGEGDHVQRRIGYMLAMERLYETYPDDPEIAAFYSLSMLSAAGAVRSGYTPPAPMMMLSEDAGAADAQGQHDMPMDMPVALPRLPGRTGAEIAERLSVRAGAISQGLFTDNPDHPGAPHYMIHSFDDPLHAPMALEAAYRFSEIAAAVSHARHMPTHIFIQLGMWDRVSANNQSAYEAAADLWVAGDDMGAGVHSLDWGQYGDLQLGNYDKAKLWIRRLEVMANGGGFLGHKERGEPGHPGMARAVNTLDLVKARYVVETEEWSIQPVTEESTPNELLATALSAYHLDDQEALGQAEAALADATGQRADIIYKQVSALYHAGMGHGDYAVELMQEAQTAVEALPPPRGAASPIKPVHELFGELLMDLGRPLEAIEKFEASLLRMPERPRSLLGLGRALAATGNTVMAGPSYEKLAEMWAGHEEIPGMLEARGFWRMHLTGRHHGDLGPMDYARLGM